MQEDFLKPSASQRMVMMGMTEQDRDRERGDLTDHGGHIIDTVPRIKEHGTVLPGQQRHMNAHPVFEMIDARKNIMHGFRHFHSEETAWTRM